MKEKITTQVKKIRVSKKAVTIVGAGLVLLSLYYIVSRVVQDDELIMAFPTSPAVIAGLVLVSVVIGHGYLFAGVNFRWLMLTLSGFAKAPEKIPFWFGVKVYVTANLFKYLPGSVMYVLGRNRLSLEIKEISHIKVALGTALEGIFVIVAGLVTVTVIVRRHFVTWLGTLNANVPVLTIALFLLFVLVILGLVFRRRMAVAFRKMVAARGDFSVRSSVRMLAVSFLILAVLGLTFVAVVMLLGQPVTLGMVPVIAGMYVLAWLAGLLTPGAAGGLGVRELVLFMVLPEVIDPGVAVTAAALHRGLCIGGDLCAYGLTAGYSKMKNRERK